MQDYKPKSFWQKPEGVVGAIFLVGVVGGLGYLLATIVYPDIVDSYNQIMFFAAGMSTGQIT